MGIPPSFDYEFYARENGGLATWQDAYDHFNKIGKQRGLKGSRGCDQGYFLGLIQETVPESILEIGPGSNPRLVGDNVYYFDVKTEEELRQRYKNDGGVDRVPSKIHFVQANGDLAVIDRRFSAVFSSHVIEHTADIVAHLNQIDRLLNEGGFYFLVVPNKNYTFDYYKPKTTLEVAIATHLYPNGVDFHFLKSYLLEEFRRAHNTATMHWQGDHGEVRGVNKRIEELRKSYERVEAVPVARSGYHRWIFDEESFVELINGLHQVGLSPLKVRECYNTIENSLSFNAILSR